MEPSTPASVGLAGEEYTFRGSDGPETALRWKGLGRRIGWIDGEDLYLEPEASYAAAQEVARELGDGLAVSSQTLRRRLKERGLLVSCERDKTTNRRTLEEPRARRFASSGGRPQCAETGGTGGTRGQTHQKPRKSPRVSSPCFNGRAAKPGGETGENPTETTVVPCSPCSPGFWRGRGRPQRR